MSGTTPSMALDRMSKAVERLELVAMRGRVRQVVGTIIHAAVPEVRIGELCILRHPHTGEELMAEVIGLADELALLTPIGEMRGLSTRTEVIPTGRTLDVPVGPELLGRVLDALGQPLDGRPLETSRRWPVELAPPAPMSRQLIDEPLPVGLRVMDGMLTCGEGQRVGIFGPPGCGKSTLLASIVGGAAADVAVVALIGERGREVREFIERSLDDAGRARSVIVCATSDRPAMERVKAAYVATSIAEYFRDQGLKVLLLMDSVTRFARAQREIGLAAGEPPTRRGFPPSVFAQLPRLMERAGRAERGSITAFYTVLVEGEDLSEPIAEEVRAVLDGHVILSRKLAGAGHFPAIDILASASRVMSAVAGGEHRQAALQVRRLMARWAEIELLVQIGEYREGADPVADEAVRRMPAIEDYLRQGAGEHTSFRAAVDRLQELLT